MGVTPRRDANNVETEENTPNCVSRKDRGRMDFDCDLVLFLRGRNQLVRIRSITNTINYSRAVEPRRYKRAD